MPTPTPQIGGNRDLEILMDAFAYQFATDPRTSEINWILGDVGMGSPADLPFGYISVMTEAVTWYSANGGAGGLATAGLDDWQITVVLNICIEPHSYIPPIAATPPGASPFNAANNAGFTPPYLEQPGWRSMLEVVQNIKKVMRTSPTILGAATDTRLVESRPVLLEVHDRLYRAVRVTIMTQQRRIRGN